MNIYIYGRGVGLPFVKRCLSDDVTVKAYIDNFTRDDFDKDGIRIVRKENIDEDCDYVVVSIVKYEEIKKDLIESGVIVEKIICFFNREDADNECFYSVLKPHKWKTELTWKYQNDVVRPTMDNMYYEINAERLKEDRKIPHIIDPESTIRLIIDEHKSLIRFGDGEFEIMLNRQRPRFQKVDVKLGDRLKEIIRSDNAEVLLAIADNYGNLSDYTDDAANGIRMYLTPSVRSDHMHFLDTNRDYYNAYLSRPYIMYRNKDASVMKNKFCYIKKIWDKKDILIVEGYHTRFGVGNDLIDNAKSVIRIIAPDKNAFDYYDNILNFAMEYADERLVLVTLGPTATVLAYDLAIRGYWAVDIGQVDTEYEWYLRGAVDRINIPYKSVSEYADKFIYPDIDEPFKSVYEDQIVKMVGTD